MQNQPFLGLSVLIHLLIISYFKLFGRSGARGEPHISPQAGKIQRLFVTTITATTVFVVVGTNAAFLVYASTENQYSTLSFIERAIASEHVAHVPVPSSVPEFSSTYSFTLFR